MFSMLQGAINVVFSYFAAVDPSCPKPRFFGLVPWYEYLRLEYVQFPSGGGECRIADFQLLGAKSTLLPISLAIVDDLLRVAGMVAVGFIIYGGVKYIMSQGSPEETAAAQKTIINALIGLVLAIMAVGIVSFIGKNLLA